MDVPYGNEGSLTGTTPVVVAGPPAIEGQQYVIPAEGIAVYNADSAARVVTIQKNKAASIFVVAVSASLAPGDLFVLQKRVVLDATDEQLEIVSDASAATTEPTFDVAAMLCELPA